MHHVLMWIGAMSPKPTFGIISATVKTRPGVKIINMDTYTFCNEIFEFLLTLTVPNLFKLKISSHGHSLGLAVT